MWLSSLFLFTFLVWAPITSAVRCYISEDVLDDSSIGCNWNINMSFQDIFDNNPDLSLLEIHRRDGNSSYTNLGTIPDSIETMTSLGYFQVRGVSLVGSIPAGIARLPNLHTLKIFDSDLVGSFPEEIFQMESLGVLYLENIGDRLDPIDLPTSGVPPELRWVTIVNIPTTRSFPIDWVNSVSKMESLTLSNLNVGGVISEIRPDRLTKLLLINNQLSGELPLITDVPWEKLELLRLEGNNFTGSIPAEYEGYIQDHGLTLSIVPNTQVTGIVPKGSQMCQYKENYADPTYTYDCGLDPIVEYGQLIYPLRFEGQPCFRDANCIDLSDENQVFFSKCAYGYCCRHDVPASCLGCSEYSGKCINDGVSVDDNAGEPCTADETCALGLQTKEDIYLAKCAYGYCCNKDAPLGCLECAGGSGECINDGQGGSGKSELDETSTVIIISVVSGLLLSGLVAYRFRMKKSRVESAQDDNLEVGVVVHSGDVPMAEIHSDDPPGMST